MNQMKHHVNRLLHEEVNVLYILRLKGGVCRTFLLNCWSQADTSLDFCIRHRSNILFKDELNRQRTKSSSASLLISSHNGRSVIFGRENWCYLCLWLRDGWFAVLVRVLLSREENPLRFCGWRVSFLVLCVERQFSFTLPTCKVRHWVNHIVC